MSSSALDIAHVGARNTFQTKKKKKKKPSLFQITTDALIKMLVRDPSPPACRKQAWSSPLRAATLFRLCSRSLVRLGRLVASSFVPTRTLLVILKYICLRRNCRDLSSSVLNSHQSPWDLSSNALLVFPKRGVTCMVGVSMSCRIGR